MLHVHVGQYLLGGYFVISLYTNHKPLLTLLSPEKHIKTGGSCTSSPLISHSSWLSIQFGVQERKEHGNVAALIAYLCRQHLLTARNDPMVNDVIILIDEMP